MPRKSALERRAYNRAYARTMARLKDMYPTPFNAIMAQELEQSRKEVFEDGAFYRKPGPRKKEDRFRPQGDTQETCSSTTDQPDNAQVAFPGGT